MIGHPFNVERITNIVVQEKKLSLDSLDINSDDYSLESDIDQVYEWIGYSDAHRIVRFGLDSSVKHVMMLSIQLRDEIKYIEDESTYDKLMHVNDMMRRYIIEYQYDRRRHSISHINSAQCESYDLSSKAYDIKKNSKYHIFLRFYTYLRNSLDLYIEIKEELISFLKQTEPDVDKTALFQKYDEVNKFGSSG